VCKVVAGLRWAEGCCRAALPRPRQPRLTAPGYDGVPLGDRGPQGVWTLQRAGAPLPPAQSSFAAAKPSRTHQARPLADGPGPPALPLAP